MTRYEKGFIEKCAEYGVDGAAVLSHMQKQAGIERVLKAISKFYHKPGKMLHSVSSVPGAVERGGYYASAGGSNLNEVSKLGKGGLRWDRILATLGLGGAAAGGAAALSGGSSSPAMSPTTKALIAALGLGGAAAGGAAAASASKKKKDDGSEDDKKKKKDK